MIWLDDSVRLKLQELVIIGYQTQWFLNISPFTESCNLIGWE